MTDREKVVEFISSGADIAGAAVGGAIGFMAVGPFGAAVAGAMGVVTTKTIIDIASRSLSNREEIKVSATAAYSLAKIGDYFNDNKVLRDESFFTGINGKRAVAEEIFEGVLLKGKSEYEELKIKHIGYFFSNLCFMDDLRASDASYYLQLSEMLTFNQFCILRAFNLLDDERKEYWRSNTLLKLWPENPELAAQISSLCQSGLLTPQSTFEVDVKITEMGQKLVALLSLDLIENEYYDEILSVLNNPPERY